MYVNGHEWLARKLAARGIALRFFDNAFVELADAEKAAKAWGILGARMATLLHRLAGRSPPAYWLAGQQITG